VRVGDGIEQDGYRGVYIGDGAQGLTRGEKAGGL